MPCCRSGNSVVPYSDIENTPVIPLDGPATQDLPREDALGKLNEIPSEHVSRLVLRYRMFRLISYLTPTAMKVKTGVFYDKKGLKKFKPRISDVICAIPAKSGTTWVQQICHQIRVKGRPFDFDDQNDIMPWIERASYLLGTDLNAEHVANPRVFKSHLPYHLVPTGTKKIFCFRNMADTMLSFCKFALPRMGISTARALEFLEMLILTGEVKDRLRDARNWWSHRNDEDVLFIFFEDLLERPREVVTRIGKFMDPSFDDDKLVDLVVDQTNHRAMAAHPTKCAPALPNVA
ncbi:hypothetical protein CYMTET_27548 [Cymbomonas tetramitiformis]|uniref:Sulfotransferase n=1 Tax=Cymbomonas tetramitiformis TaxID=36881 RepID=A0AAE0FPL0_9CHLO|nr:hypothetical protein CYMTET_27548 [Cymbomonas tetramitiformis]|eukprot:gene3202-4047_t